MSRNPAPRSAGGVKSLLTPPQRRWLTVAMLLTSLLLANTLYLLTNRILSSIPGQTAARFADGGDRISKLFQVMVLSHTGLGFLVVTLLLIFSMWHLPRVWRRHRPQTVTSGIIFLAAGLILTVTGPFIMYAAASRQNAWIWWSHVVAAIAAPIAYLVHRRMSVVSPPTGAYNRFASAMVSAFALLIVAHGFTHRAGDTTRQAVAASADNPGPGARERNLSDFLNRPYVPPGFVPPQSPFFPSAATTTTGEYLPSRIITRGDFSTPEILAEDLDAIGFVVKQQIGAESCVRCHPDTVEQWSRSAHRFASFNNPFYEATINDMRAGARAMTHGVSAHIEAFAQWQDRTGEIKSKWCSGCHDPAIMLAGRMTDPIDRRTLEAQAGLTCLACHAIDAIHNNTGNGNYNIADEEEDPYLFADAPEGTLAALLHDTALKSKPAAHKRQLLTPAFGTSEYCAACHKVSIPRSVNNYRWLRAQNEYDNWHDSGVSLNAARTFYLPPFKRACQDCHMPLEPAPLGDLAAENGMVRSHRFLAVNTALPHLRGDTETIERIESFLQAEKLRIDLFALHHEDDAGSTATQYALDETRPALIAGEHATFDVVVRNFGVGHTFPGGTNDSNQGWIEFTFLDAEGRTLAQSGFVRDDRYVDPAAHFFRAVLVDREGDPIHRRNAPDIYATVYSNVIGPGTAHAVHYRVNVPHAVVGQVTVRARLLWRKFDRAFTEFAYRTNPEGFKRFPKCPDLPITEICRTEVTLPVADNPPAVEAASENPTLDNVDWTRFNDYGIGLLLQNDTKRAETAFAQVTRLEPNRVDGPRNLARVALRDGNLPRAYEHLLRCEELVPNDPQSAWFWGVLLQEDGRYVEAASAYRRVLQKFPDDRATWRNLGRTFFLDGKFEHALKAMQEVLRIDPEDRVAHYHAMLCNRALGREEQAAVSESAYLRYKIDESAEEVTQDYRLKHPHDNRETQPIHIHDLSLATSSTQAAANAPSAGHHTLQAPNAKRGGTSK